MAETEDRQVLDRLAEEARHWQDVQELREQQAELRARRSSDQSD